MQLYPGWSARDNYAVLGKKKKRRKDKNQGKFIVKFLWECWFFSQ